MTMRSQTALVHFQNIYVNSMQSACGVFVGTNTQYGWSSHAKDNAALGSVSGNYNSTSDNLNVLIDNDLIDAPISDPDLIIG